MKRRSTIALFGGLLAIVMLLAPRDGIASTIDEFLSTLAGQKITFVSAVTPDEDVAKACTQGYGHACLPPALQHFGCQPAPCSTGVASSWYSPCHNCVIHYDGPGASACTACSHFFYNPCWGCNYAPVYYVPFVPGWMNDYNLQRMLLYGNNYWYNYGYCGC